MGKKTLSDFKGREGQTGDFEQPLTGCLRALDLLLGPPIGLRYDKVNAMRQAHIIGACRIKPVVQAIVAKIAFQGGVCLFIKSDSIIRA